MLRNNTQTVSLSSEQPLVVLSLKSYETLVAKIEDLEDAISLKERKDEKNIPWSAIEKKFSKKYGK